MTPPPCRLLPVLVLAVVAPRMPAQEGEAAPAPLPGGLLEPRVEIPWNRFYRYQEILELEQRLAAAWPRFVRLEDIGSSWEGRPLRLLVLTDQESGDDRDKPAMWVDGNVHGNEVQGAEAALYLAWWLLEHRATNPRARLLLETRTFYILPSQNPDGREYWFDAPNTASSSRSGKAPLDDDRDGLFDEDPPDDLDGDGEILTMRRRVPPGTGTHRLDPDDPRILVPVEGDEEGDWVILGREGIDNDGDGRINEDGPGGYDMNRNWPADWQPPHIQHGAGDYPFSWPETRAIGRFLLAHPNVAAVQSFHNSGGMILRGPGAREIDYPAADLRTFDALGEEGERMLPFYRYMVIWRDLYTVHGGFVNWAYEGLGVFAFSNELWSSARYDGQRGGEGWRDRAARNRQRLEWDDALQLGEDFVDWHPVQHPLYGEVEVGGFRRRHGRVPPSFMIEEMLHRNAMFCARHAEEIPELEALEPVLEELGGGLWRLRLTVRNRRTLPTRSALAAREHIGTPDRALLEGPAIQVLAGGVLPDRWRPERFQPETRHPARILVEEGVPGHGHRELQWLLQGHGEFTIRYLAEKAADLELHGRLP